MILYTFVRFKEVETFHTQSFGCKSLILNLFWMIDDAQQHPQHSDNRRDFHADHPLYKSKQHKRA